MASGASESVRFKSRANLLRESLQRHVHPAKSHVSLFCRTGSAWAAQGCLRHPRGARRFGTSVTEPFCTPTSLLLRGYTPTCILPPMPDKIVIWVGASFEDLLDFPPEARRTAGYELRRIQRGLMPTDWKPMSSVGPGVNEIRIHTDVEHRVMYVAKFEEAVYVLHAFEKRSRQTRDTDLALARERLKQIEALRREERRGR